VKTGYEETPIGRIPEDWEVVRLGEVILDISDGGTPSTKVKKYFDGDIPWINIEDIKKDIYDTRRHLSEAGLKNSSAKLWDRGTVIFSFGASIGKVGIARNKICTKQGIAGIIPNPEKLYNEFLYFVLLKQGGKIKQIGKGMGSTITEVRPSKLKKLIVFPLPPLPEQKKIASILSTVDDAIQKVDEAIAKTERLKKGLMQKLLTKGIGHKEFKYSKELRCEIPKEWGVVRLAHANIETIDGDRGVNYPKQSDFSGKGVCLFLNAKNVTENGFKFIETQFISKEKDAKMGKGKLERYDVVLTTRGTVGNVGYYDDNVLYEHIRINSGMVILRNKNKDVDNKFLYLLFRTPFLKTQIKRIAYGTAQPQLNVRIIKNLKIILPPLTEQQKIAEILSTVDKKLELGRNRKEKLERIKKGLMNDLLTGKKRVKVS